MRPVASTIQQFILVRDGQRIVYDIHDARLILRRRHGRWHKYLAGTLPGGVRFEAGYGPANAVEVRRWERANGITPAQRTLERALHAVVDRLAEAVGIRNVLGLCVKALASAGA